MYSLLNTALTSISRSMARSMAWRTRTSASALLFGPLATLSGITVPELGHTDHPEPGVPADLGQVRGRGALDHVEVARAQAREARGGVDDGHELHAVDVD